MKSVHSSGISRCRVDSLTNQVGRRFRAAIEAGAGKCLRERLRSAFEPTVAVPFDEPGRISDEERIERRKIAMKKHRYGGTELRVRFTFAGCHGEFLS